MEKLRPNWSVWKYVQEVDAMQAVALTLNREPRAVSSEAAKSGVFADRLFLFKSHFGSTRKTTLGDLARWAHSVDWNIPLELSEFAPASKVTHPPAPDNVVTAALSEIILPGANMTELRDLLAGAGLHFVNIDGSHAIHVQDGTVKGTFHPMERVHSVVSNLSYTPKNERIAHLIRGSGASGGGAVGSSPSASYTASVEQKDVATEGPPPTISPPPTTKIKLGITKQQAITAFASLVGIDLAKALADTPKWLDEARVSKGTRGGAHVAIWDPVLLAVCLNERHKVETAKLGKAFSNHAFLKAWIPEWQETLQMLD